MLVLALPIWHGARTGQRKVFKRVKKFSVWHNASMSAAILFGGLCMPGALSSEARASTMASPDERTRMKDALVNDAAIPTIAPQGYDVTIVVFSDYQCPYCRKLHGDLKQLLATDRKVRVVYRDWPIFGGASREAARAAMASRYQGKYAAFNDALMSGPVKLDQADIRQAATRAGVDWARLQADLARNQPVIDTALRKTNQLAEMIGLTGTPGLVIGDYLIPGAIDAATLRGTVQKARQSARTANTRR
ncbi:MULTISPECIES: DsbA family protein [unclassified Novosphingobium]|uniref:DsbA family protein n=1 Tax=unclassified Novosphingobium TaxID=2644732 RepID=UPI001356E424|nr:MULTISPECIES: DsbA family protein [unclassified Novosphingobium]